MAPTDVVPARTNTSLPQPVCCVSGAALLPMSQQARVCLVASHRAFSKPRAAKVPVISMSGKQLFKLRRTGGPLARRRGFSDRYHPLPRGDRALFFTLLSLRTLASFYPISSRGGDAMEL